MILNDTVQLAGARLTRDGYLVADVRAARVGIQHYAGFEVGKPDMEVVRVYRPANEVFARDSLASFAHRPVTDNHPPEMVSAATWRKYAVGDIGGEVVRDGDHVRVPLTLMDKAAIDALQAGKRELSAGYECDLKWEGGTTPDGQTYDAVQTGIRINHVALVDRGRAGSACRIGDDGKPQIQSPSDHLAIVTAGRAGSDCRVGDGQAAHPHGEPEMNLRKILVDGIAVETTDAAATVIETLTKRLSDAATVKAAMEATHDAALKAKDAALGEKDAKIADLESKVLDAAALDKLVTERS